MGLNLNPQYGQTKLSEEEKEGLIPAYITTNAELNYFDQTNISEALLWLISQKPTTENIIEVSFIIRLHKKMYGDTWKWAGSFRTTNKNIGISWTKIPLELKKLMDDAHFWVNNKVYEPAEIAIRVKHRIVSIHCFPNGNGRHSRILADTIIQKGFGLPKFTWGADAYSNQTSLRKAYINALREADTGSIASLLAFAVS
jgi:Fic-DOC domain mobile mystery protein B